MGEFIIGILVGIVLGACIVGFLWNESVYDENDQKKKR